MDKVKRQALEAAGWRFGNAADFLGTTGDVRATNMRNKNLPLRLSRDEEQFLRHWMYDEFHYRDGLGLAKQLQLRQKAVPAELATLIAAAIPDPAEQEAVGIGPPPVDPPKWPWSEASLHARVAEARGVLAQEKGTAL